jgi:hypothetical protein
LRRRIRAEPHSATNTRSKATDLRTS